jgi:RHS repeat-associated protein
MGFPILVPHDGTIIAMAMPAAEGGGVGDFGLDQPTHGPVLIADGGHHPGASNSVGNFTTGQSLVFYLNTNFGPSYLSTSNHAKIVKDGPEVWNIGWEDAPDGSADFDYDDIVIRICFQQIPVIGCPRPVDTSYGLGGGPHSATYQAYRAEPVNTATGNYTSVTHDLMYPGRGLGIDFKRTYNSFETAISRLGVGWSDSYSVRLTFEASGWATFIGEEDEHVRFEPDGSGGFMRPIGSRDLLTVIAGGYQVLRPDQVRYIFDSGGVLQSIRDRNNNTVSMTYTSGKLTAVTDPIGRVLSLSYDGNGRLSGLSGPQAMTVGYTYDASGRLETVTDVRGFVVTYGYDASSRLASIQDQNGHFIVRNTYGPDGRVTDQYDARNNHTVYAWDAATETSTMTDPRGGTWVDKYASGVLISRTDPLGDTIRFGFNTQLQMSGVIDARGYEIDTGYDDQGNLLSRVYFGPLFAVERYTYDAQNNLLTSGDRNGQVTSMTYDAAGNLLTIRGPGPVNPLTTYTYDPAGTGLVLTITDPRSKVTSFQYDAQGNRIQTTSPGGSITTMTYDAAGRLLTVVEPRGNISGGNPSLYTTTQSYDAAGNVLTVIDALGAVTTSTYDHVGNLLSRTDANNHATTFGYDEANQLTSVTDAATKATTYTYDTVGNLATRVDANNHTTSYAYDLAERLLSTTQPLGRVWSYSYDQNGNRTKAVDAIGNSTPTPTTDGTTTYTYDQWNRVAGITYSDGTPPATYAYDFNDNRTSMVDGTGTTTYVYDSLNRPISITRPGSLGITYTYDAAGNLLARTPSGGTATTNTYDNDGRLSTATVLGLATTYGYDVAGNETSVAYPSANGYLETRTFDRAGRLTEVKNTKGSTTLSKSTYVLDPVGNRLSNASTTATTTYTYDVVNRLTQACFTPGCTGSDNFRRYTYDPVGNRLTEVSAAGTTTYNYNALDQVTSTTGPGAASYTYDLDGNQITAGSALFTWSLAMTMKTANVAGTTTTYTYDGDGLRMSAATGTQANKTTRFLWDTNSILPILAREMDGNNSLQREYQYGADLISMRTGSSTYFFHHDGLGSILNVTSATGAAQWTYDYLPFGAQRTATKNSNQAPTNMIRYAGEYLDTTSRYYLRAREYDPAIGQFLSTDPVASARRDPAVGPYVYAGNNPIGKVDASGQCPMTAAFVFLFGGLGTFIGPEGTVGGAALGLSVGTAMCAEETLAEITLAKAVIDQTQGQAIPQPAPAPFTVTPYNPNPGPPINPDTGDQEPTGRGCKSVACRAAAGAAAAAIAGGGALMGGTHQAEEGGEPYPIAGRPPK